MNAPPREHGRITAPTQYAPVWWLPDGHSQTLWAALCRRVPGVVTRTERVALPDGDFVDLAHVGRTGAPIVLVLHGLEGNLHSPYARALMIAIVARGWHGVLLHFRGCSGVPNRLARSYHSGDTDDLAHVVDLLRQRTPALAITGYSLGGNVLLKYLGERGADIACAAACAVSVPFDLALAADTLNRGFARIYQRRLVASLQAKARRKFRLIAAPIDLAGLARWSDFRTFDERVTAPLHGFAGAGDYYTRSSSRPFLRHIAVPTLVVHALDDPFLAAGGIPSAPELGAPITLELATRGGHVGFVTTEAGWLERRITDFIAAASADHAAALRVSL